MKSLFPDDSSERKTYPIYSGFLRYFPAAVAAVAHHSYLGNEKHNPGQPLHWDRAKSGDEKDAQCRHLMESEIAGYEHELVGMAWRAMATLQKYLESKGAPTAPAARNVYTSAEHAQKTAESVHVPSPSKGIGQPQGDDESLAYLANFGPNRVRNEVLREAGIGDVPAEDAGVTRHMYVPGFGPVAYTIGTGHAVRHPMAAEADRLSGDVL